MAKGTALATAGDMSIPTVLQQITKQIDSLKDIETSSFKTSMNLAPFGNLKTIKDVPTLIKAFSIISKKEQAYNEAAKELGVTDAPKYTEGDATTSQWKSDIQLQIRITTQKERLEELKAIKKEAEGFLDKEDKKALFFQKMMKTVSIEE